MSTTKPEILKVVDRSVVDISVVVGSWKLGFLSDVADDSSLNPHKTFKQLSFEGSLGGMDELFYSTTPADVHGIHVSTIIVVNYISRVCPAWSTSLIPFRVTGKFRGG
ncbi:339_t:CDS:2 [Ambispora gerdemannii]|uniref:339_t:CDS:1 n=1 Tax=Ambispora gerdemannii TaxID=144530 RepID=A0A9N9EFL9_9GLOM|nr:339_t:CDS:2 [Ambispora gerdemannii]